MENNTIKYLPPNDTEWQAIETDSEEQEKKTASDQNKKALNELLLSSMQMQNIVVLSGSGTSLGDAGGPSMSDLWESCTKENGSYSESANKIFGRVKYDVSDDKKVNIEELLSLCEAFSQIDGNCKEVSGFVEHCKSKILQACNFDTTNDSLDGHKTFIHRLSRRRVRDSRLKVFTTNYDTCFENAAGKQGVVVIDGFSFTKPRLYDPRFFDFDIIRRNSAADNTSNYLEGVFQLYKLHGSVNWERNEAGTIEEKEATAKGACMIFPARGKYQQSYIQPHLELMARYLSSLREPNTCILVCGFGFNDEHLSEPLISAIKTNPYLKVIIVDDSAQKNIDEKESDASDYWNTLKGLSNKGEDVWFINASFQGFANLIPDLRALTPAEKLAKNIKSLAGEKQ
ncbi:MAG: SIR2 family protein [Candidatus Scalindua sp.]